MRRHDLHILKKLRFVFGDRSRWEDARSKTLSTTPRSQKGGILENHSEYHTEK
jgi:hypothetical protein